MFGCRLYSSFGSGVMDLSIVVSALNRIAPIRLAAEWDNVGLLVEPSSPHLVQRIILTNDLTLNVLQESIDHNVNMIVSYHPPIFKPMKKLTENHWKEKILIKAIENRIAIYSPHTASDAVQGGVNDWLATGLGELTSTRPITANKFVNYGGLLLCKKADEQLFIAPVENSKKPSPPTKFSTENGTLMQLESEQVCQVADIVRTRGISDRNVQFFPASQLPNSGTATGAGRICVLRKPNTMKNVIDNIKAHLNLDHVRFGLGAGKSLNDLISTIAICAGSGASVLTGVKADLYLTGEMSHHEVLEVTQKGGSVVLCEHSNTERGYLQVLRTKLHEILGEDNLTITISHLDKDPLEIL
uniref:NIF3-like protein 1 n=1 Tax=Styela clava TaxID=7725 RepID=UPI001939AAA4|nr:NIF3-like protein 1 [Styela clava]